MGLWFLALEENYTILEVTGRGLEDKGVCVVGHAFSQEKGIHRLFESVWNGG